MSETDSVNEENNLTTRIVYNGNEIDTDNLQEVEEWLKQVFMLNQ